MNHLPNKAVAPVLLVLFFAVQGIAQQAKGRNINDLTTIRDIHVLTAEQAREARPVRLHGIVTVLSGWKDSFFFQDATSGISIDRLTSYPVLRAGQVVEVVGVTGAGMFAPVVLAKSVSVIGTGNMPAAPLSDATRLEGGKQDSQWLSIHGIVRSAVVKPSWGRSVLFLEVDIGGGNLITVRVHDFSNTDVDFLPASTVYVRGVCGTVFNDRRQFIGLRLFVSDLADVKIERFAPSDPFDSPLRPLGRLLQFRDAQGAVNRINVHGHVTYSEPGHGLYIQDDGHHGVFVRTLRPTPVALGSDVEVAGYPAIGRYSPELDDAVLRVVGPARQLDATSVAASNMIVGKDDFRAAPFDSLLVQVKGRVLEEIPGTSERLLLLEDGKSVFAVHVPESTRDSGVDFLLPKTLVSVTGICAAKADESHEAQSFEILLRSAADLVVLEPGPWWTASRAKWLVIVLTLVVFAMAGWLVLVRRQASLRLLTLTDPLTGLNNRRGFLPLAEQQWQLSLRKKKPFLLFYFDVDKFKEINDSFGHKEGDVALQTVAALLKLSFRKTDIIGRLGGDEFAVAAIDASENDRPMLEKRLAEALRKRNEKGERAFQIALSVGALTGDLSIGHLSIEDLLGRADHLMYEQKRARKYQRTGPQVVLEGA